MKWIYSMILDGSYIEFKKLYIKCVLTDEISFKFNGQTYVKSFAKNVIKYIDNNKLVKEYNKHLNDQIDGHIELNAEIMMGK